MTYKSTVAELVGKLIFTVDNRQLVRFNQLMVRAQQHMQKLGASYTKLAQQMSRTIKIKVDTSEITKAKAKLEKSLHKELQAETKLKNARRSTFAQELQNQKLRYNGTKKEATNAGALVKQQRDSAIAQAKQYRMSQKAADVQKDHLNNANSLVTAQTRQARLEAIYARTQAITAKREQAALLAQGKIAQLQHHADRLQQKHQQQQLIHQQRLQSLQNAAANAQANAQAVQQHHAARLLMLNQKNQAWHATQQAKAGRAASVAAKGGSGGMLGGLLDGGIFNLGSNLLSKVGPLGLALGGLATAAVLAKKTIDERINERQEQVIETQSFENTFKSLSKNPDIQQRYRDSFISAQMQNGQSVDLESAKQFTGMAMIQIQLGKTLEDINALWKSRQEAFTVGGVSKADGIELNRQLGKMASDGRGDSTDSQQILERLTLLTPYVVREYMAEHGMKNNSPADLKKGFGAYNKSLKAGEGVSYEWFEQGMKKMVADNQAILERNRKSNASGVVNRESTEYLAAAKINADPELARLLNERNDALTRFGATMVPVNEGLERLDKNLTAFNTAAIQWTAAIMNLISGKSPDGEEDWTNQDRFTPGDGSAVGILSKPQTEQQRLRARAQDNAKENIRRFFTGGSIEKDKAIADENRRRWSGIGADGEFNGMDGGGTLGLGSHTMPGMLATNKITESGMKRYFPNYSDWRLPPEDDVFRQAQIGLGVNRTQINAPVQIGGTEIHIELTGSEEDKQKVFETVKEQLDIRDRELPSKVGQAIQDILGDARSQQYQNQ
jgi:hypothetical protein